MPEVEHAAIDTNLLVRYLTEDDPQKAQAVENLLDRAQAGAVRLFAPSVILAELVWVLESYYKLGRTEVADLAEAVLNTPGLDVEDEALLRHAVTEYRNGKMDFIDAMLLVYTRTREIGTIYTFDRTHFRDEAGIVCKRP